MPLNDQKNKFSDFILGIPWHKIVELDPIISALCENNQLSPRKIDKFTINVF